MDFWRQALWNKDFCKFGSLKFTNLQILPTKFGQNFNLDSFEKDSLDIGDYISVVYSFTCKMFLHSTKLKIYFQPWHQKGLFTLWL